MASLSINLTRKVLSFGYLQKAQEEREKALRAAGIHVTTVDNVAEALSELREKDFEVLIVDPAVPPIERDRVAAFAKTRNIRTIFLYKHYISGAECGDALISTEGSAA